MSARLYTAFVLHRIAYRETSYLVDLFTLEQGKVRGVAKGIRGSKSDRKSLLQPFQLLEVSVSGRSDLKNIGRLESKGPPQQLSQQQLFAAMYMNEIVNRCLPEALVIESLFEFYQLSLQKLQALQHVEQQSRELLEAVLREFEIHLLTHLGVMPDLTHCSNNGALIEEQGFYSLNIETGFSQAMPNPRPSALLFKGANLRDIARAHWHVESLKAAKLLVRIALRPLLGEKPLKSRALFGEVK